MPSYQHLRFGQKYWGQGFATEACHALLQHASQHLGVGLVRGSCINLDEGKAALRDTPSFSLPK